MESLEQKKYREENFFNKNSKRNVKRSGWQKHSVFKYTSVLRSSDVIWHNERMTFV